MTESAADVGRWLRTVRRERSLSQRELADLAQVPLSTIAAIEVGRRSPRVALLLKILAATGHGLAVVDSSTGFPASADDEHDAVRDRGGRRLPAHLQWGDRPTFDTDPSWWGWQRFAWPDNTDPRIPDHTWRHRPREARGPLREHPWFGQFRGRDACRGPVSEPCLDCLGECRFEAGPGKEPGKD